MKAACENKTNEGEREEADSLVGEEQADDFERGEYELGVEKADVRGVIWVHWEKSDEENVKASCMQERGRCR